MKLTRTLALAVAIGTAMIPVIAQTPQQTQTTPAPLSAKARALCKEWTFIGSETFSMPQDPTEAQKGDKLILMDNGQYKLTMDGKAQSGKWTTDASAVWITLTADTGGLMKLRILERTDKRLKVDYRDKDDVHNILIYEVK